MTNNQIDKPAIKYVLQNAIPLIEAARHGKLKGGVPKPPGGVRFVESWYCPAGRKGPVEQQKGARLTASGKVEPAYWRFQTPKSREGAKFTFGNYGLMVIRGRMVDNIVTPMVSQSPGSEPRLVLHVGPVPGKTSGRSRTGTELHEHGWRLAAPSTVYIPRRGDEEGWKTRDFEAHLSWWLMKAGIAGPDVEASFKRYVNGLWKDPLSPGVGLGCAFDGNFKAPLSPLSLKAYVTFQRKLSFVHQEPRLANRPGVAPGDVNETQAEALERLGELEPGELEDSKYKRDVIHGLCDSNQAVQVPEYPAKVRDMAYYLGIGERMLYRHADQGLVPCEIIEGKRGREFFFLENHEQELTEFYCRREQRKRTLDAWQLARGVGEKAAREWLSWNIKKGVTLDELERRAGEELKKKVAK